MSGSMTKAELFKGWRPGLTEEQGKDLAYFERNMMALRFGDGWYYDDEWKGEEGQPQALLPRFDGWRRVISCLDGSMCFHVPDEFDVGNLPQIGRNWDGHTTEQKWLRVAEFRGVTV